MSIFHKWLLKIASKPSNLSSEYFPLWDLFCFDIQTANSNFWTANLNYRLRYMTFRFCCHLSSKLLAARTPQNINDGKLCSNNYRLLAVKKKNFLSLRLVWGSLYWFWDSTGSIYLWSSYDHYYFQKDSPRGVL